MLTSEIYVSERVSLVRKESSDIWCNRYNKNEDKLSEIISEIFEIRSEKMKIKYETPQEFVYELRKRHGFLFIWHSNFSHLNQNPLLVDELSYIDHKGVTFIQPGPTFIRKEKCNTHYIMDFIISIHNNYQLGLPETPTLRSDSVIRLPIYLGDSDFYNFFDNNKLFLFRLHDNNKSVLEDIANYILLLMEIYTDTNGDPMQFKINHKNYYYLENLIRNIGDKISVKPNYCHTNHSELSI